MLMEQYFAAVEALYKKIRRTQTAAIMEAAELMAGAIAGGARVHLHDTGHLIDSEMIYRAGGPAIYNRLRYTLNVETMTAPRDESGKNKSMEGLAQYALRASRAMPGDVLIVGSVSGKSPSVIDLALQAKKMGLRLVTLSSHEYSGSLKSEHSSGCRLFELGEVNIDNCAPHGDAMLETPGVGVKILPASGLAAAYVMWALTAALTEAMLARGCELSYFSSVNFPGNAEKNELVRRRFEELGY